MNINLIIMILNWINTLKKYFSYDSNSRIDRIDDIESDDVIGSQEEIVESLLSTLKQLRGENFEDLILWSTDAIVHKIISNHEFKKDICMKIENDFNCSPRIMIKSENPPPNTINSEIIKNKLYITIDQTSPIIQGTQAQLSVINGKEFLEKPSYDLEGNTIYRVGRRDKATTFLPHDIVIKNNLKVSRLQAEIFSDGDYFVIKRIPNSSIIKFIRDGKTKTISEQRLLKDGDIIVLGDTIKIKYRTT